MRSPTSTGIVSRLMSGTPLLLDAAMGSDLDRRGLRTTLPLWSAIGLIDAPDLVRRIHVENLLAGADVVTTNTFRSTARTLEKAGIEPGRAAELDALAIRLAREAIAEAERSDALVAGSIAPLEDCYLPNFEVPEAAAVDEHRERISNLAAAGVDFLLIETMPTSDEAVLALRAARETGLPSVVSFVCAPLDEGDSARLLSGQPLREAVASVEPLEPAAILVNCAAPPVVHAAIEELRSVTRRPFGGYANVGHVDDDVGWSSSGGLSGAVYAAAASAWLDLGARMIGGCCGTNPAHTAALRAMIDAR